MGAESGYVARGAAWLALSIAVGGLIFVLQACLERPPPRVPPPVETRLSSPAALAPFFTALAALEERQTQGPTRVLQLGDSHTANDSLSGRLRDRFHARFGDAGRGWLPAGLAFGLDASDAQSEPPEASMAIESTDSAGFDRVAVEYLTQPQGSAFTVQVDGGAPIRVSTAAAQPAI